MVLSFWQGIKLVVALTEELGFDELVHKLTT